MKVILFGYGSIGQRHYANLKALEPVIETDDDPEYTVMHNELVKCFRVVNSFVK